MTALPDEDALYGIEVHDLIDDTARPIVAAKLREIAARDDPRLARARGMLLEEADHLDAGLPIFTKLAAGQIWQRHRPGRDGVIQQVRVEGANDRYVYGVSLVSGRPTRIMRSRDHVGGPLGYHLIGTEQS